MESPCTTGRQQAGQSAVAAVPAVWLTPGSSWVMPADGGSPLAERQNCRCSYLVHQRYFAAAHAHGVCELLSRGRPFKFCCCRWFHHIMLLLLLLSMLLLLLLGAASNLWLPLLVGRKY